MVLLQVGGEPSRSPQHRRHQGKLIDVDPVILASARKHGIADDDMLHAYRHPIRVFDLDDLTMLIGPDTEPLALLGIGVAQKRRASSSSSTPWPPDRSSWRPDAKDQSKRSSTTPTNSHSASRTTNPSLATSAQSRNTCSNEPPSQEPAASARSSTPSPQPAPRASPGSASVNSSEPQPKPPNNATAPSSRPADTARQERSGRADSAQVGRLDAHAGMRGFEGPAHRRGAIATH